MGIVGGLVAGVVATAMFPPRNEAFSTAFGLVPVGFTEPSGLWMAVKFAGFAAWGAALGALVDLYLRTAEPQRTMWQTIREVVRTLYDLVASVARRWSTR